MMADTRPSRTTDGETPDAARPNRIGSDGLHPETADRARSLAGKVVVQEESPRSPRFRAVALSIGRFASIACVGQTLDLVDPNAKMRPGREAVVPGRAFWGLLVRMTTMGGDEKAA